jgi:hypothetical protein
MLQPSQLHSCQSADDWDNKRVDNNNDVDVNTSYWRNDRDDNCSDHDSGRNDVDVRNCY